MTDHHDSALFDDSLSIAIVGMAGRFPQAANIDLFWEKLRDEVECIRRYTPEELEALGIDRATSGHADFVPVGAFLPDIELFDAAFFGMMPRDAELTDPQQRLFLEASWAALEHAGHDPARYDGSIGVYGGAAFNGYFYHHLSRNPRALQAATPMQLTLGNGADFLCGRVAYHLGLRGPAVTVQTACSTSLVAIHLACQALIAGECDMALAGGVSLDVNRMPGYRYVEGDIRSRDGHCRAFDSEASGTVPGSGLGVVVLKTVERARADGDTIHALIRGSAINNDGAHKVGFTAPSAEGQAAVLAQALGAAGVTAASVSYIETHGTATTLGDPIEFNALRRIYGKPRANGETCAIGSAKSNVGHLDAAAGVTGLIKTVLALRHRQIPASLHFNQPNPHIDLAGSALTIAAHTQPWHTPANTPRRAGISSFGIGGTNAHVVLEEAPAQAGDAPSRAHQLLPLSAKSPAALDAAAANLAAFLAANPLVELADVAFTLQVGRARFGYRRTLVCASADDARALLEQAAGADATPDARAEDGPGVMFLFPGQGAQHTGMAQALYAQPGVFRDTLSHCAAVLEPMLGLDIRSLLYPANAEAAYAAQQRLNRTSITQPALFAIEYALARQWQAWGIEPAGMLGHSVGEYVAACVAGVFSADDALRIVSTRGSLIERLAAEGAMLAVHTSAETLQPLLGDRLWLAAINHADACSVSGSHEAIAALTATLDTLGIGHQPIVTSHAFHSGLLDPVLGAFRRVFDSVTLHAPRLRYVSNLSGDWISARQATDPAYWVDHLRGTVRFADGLHTLLDAGPCVLLEVGPGSTLGGLARSSQDARKLPAILASLPHRKSALGADVTLTEALGALWRHGVDIDWSAYHGDERRQRIALPLYPFERRRHWVGAEPDQGAPRPTAARPRAVKNDDRSRWFYAPSWHRAPMAPAAGTEKGVHLLFATRAEDVAALVVALRSAGETTIVASVGSGFSAHADGYRLNPREEADYQALFAALQAAGSLPRRITHCLSLGDAPDMFNGILSLHAIARALHAQMRQQAVTLAVVSNGIYSVTGEERLVPEHATLIGPCQVIGLEYPAIGCRLIDIDDTTLQGQASERLCQALLSQDAAPVTALRRMYHWTPSMETVQLPEPLMPALKAAGHYLIVGGTGGIGSLFAEHVARSVAQPRLTLIGRTVLPAVDAWDDYLAQAPQGDALAEKITLVRQLRGLGAEVLYLAADLADRTQMGAAAERATAAFGAPRGYFNGAAEAGGSHIADEQPAATARALAAKITGLQVLAEVFDLAGADFVLLCSSLAAFAPIAGQSSYSAANAFVDAFAHKLHLAGTHSIAVNWNTWQGVGMARLIRVPDAFREQLQLYLSNGIGASDAPQLFERVLGAGLPQVVVCPVDYAALAAGTARLTEALENTPPTVTGSSSPRPTLATPYAAPASELEQRLAELWQTQFGIAPIGRDDDFFDLGGHSLLAAQIVASVRQSCNLNLPLRSLFDAPSIAGLAAAVERLTAVEAPLERIQPRTPDSPAPLSFAQQRLWFLARMEGASAAYHMPAALHLRGELDVAALRWAFASVIERHQALRTVFVEADGDVQQRVLPTDGFALTVEDRPELADDAATLERLAGEEARAPFDLAAGPLIRCRLWRLAEQRHVLLVTMHHIVSDGVSMAVFTDELSVLYRSHRQGTEGHLPPLPIQYADYALWQRETLRGDALNEHGAYWLRTLGGAPALLQLPTDRPRPLYQDHRGASVDLLIAPSLVSALEKLSRRQGVTTFMTLLAGWALMLSRFADQTDVVIGTPAANRSRGEVAGLIGFFINTLAIRVETTPTLSVGALLQQVKTRTLEGQAHQDFPFEQVVEILKPARIPSHSPVFQTLFAWQKAAGLELDLGDLSIDILGTDQRTAKFDLLLDLREIDGRIVGAIEYASALFDASTVQRYADCLLHVLDAMTRDDLRALDDLPLLDPQGLRQALEPFNTQEPRYAAIDRVHPLFDQQAARSPEALAVVGPDHCLTYAQLQRHANRLARQLRAQGVGPDTRVALCMERSAAMVVAVLAVLKAAGAYVPLDPAYPAERLAYMLADSEPVCVLADASTLDKVASSAAPVLSIDLDRATLWDEPAPEDIAQTHHLAYVIYTSGSTGQPKGVAMPHAALANLISWQIDQPGEAPTFAARTLQFAALSFDVAFQEIFSTLCSGGELHLVERDVRIDFPRLLKYLRTQGIERLFLPYVALHSLAQAAMSGDTELPHSLREVIVAGEQLRITPAIGAFFKALPSCRLHNHYGPSESHVVTAETLPREVSDWPLLPAIGRPLPNTRLYVLDARQRQVPPGMPGELYIGGVQVGRDYLNRPALSAERFVSDSHAQDPEARLYKTGDLVRWLADGRLEYLGRNDAQVKLRGFRIEPGEIEAALSTLPHVQDALVALLTTPEGESRLVAYVVASDAGFDEWDLRASLATRLPDYMVPAHFVRLTRWPLTPSGKIDRRALPTPEFSVGKRRRDSVAPATPSESLAAGIWREVLNIDRIGAEDNFFELGGHSLLATRVISKVQRAFQVELAIRVLFEEPTLRRFAQRIDDARRATSGTLLPSISAGPPAARAPLSYAQHRLWFIDQLERGSPLYNIPVAVRMQGDLDIDAMRRAIDTIVARHAVLRTTFAETDGMPVQVIHDSWALDMPLHDLRALTPDARAARVDALSGEEARKPFDLANGPLLRMSFLALAEQEYVALLTLHHIIADGWSIGVLVQELMALYAAFVERRASPLPPLALQYADFCAWQREWLAGDVLQRQLEYWTDTLGGAPALLALPTDHPRAARRGHRGEHYSFSLDEPLTRAIRALNARTQSTLFMTLMAAYNVLLARYSGEADICVGTAIANRNRSEIEPLIGLFVNTLVIRNRVDALASFDTLLDQVRTQALDAYAHQDVPFEQVLDALAPTRSLSHQALFQVMLIVQNTPMDTLSLPGLTLQAQGSGNATAKCDLLLNVAENESEATLACGIEYDADLFDAGTIEQFAGHFTYLLRSIVSTPDAPVAALRLADPASTRRELTSWNDSARRWPDDTDCISRFEAQAQAAPDRLALAFEEQRLSYRELDQRAARVASTLLAQGVAHEDRVGVLCSRSADMLVAVLGVMKAGAAWVPLDPDAGAARLAFIVDDAAPKRVLVQRALRAKVPSAFRAVIYLDDAEQRVDPLPGDWRERRQLTAQSLAYLIYTSGSTGVPKAVGVTQGSLSNLLRAMQEKPGISADDRMLSVTSLAFDLVIPNLFLPLVCGASTVYASRDCTDDPHRLAELMERHDISLMQATPATWRLLVEQRWPRLSRPLRLLCGGDALSAELAAKLLQRVPVIWNMYGPTETTVWSSCEPVSSASAHGCIGRPLANTVIYLLDDLGNPLPKGATGELHIAGDGLARGYLGRPALTAERFIPDPFSTLRGARLYRTGDQGRYLADGRIEYLGRIDNQLKVRGFRIEAGEVEASLAAQQGVEEAVVAAQELSPGDVRLVAYVVPTAATTPTPSAWRAVLADALPDYMVPSHFVVLDALPLTANGKLDRKALPLPADAVSSSAYVEPRTALERSLALIWADLLHVGQVGLHDNFFESGGHSLLATQLVSRVRRDLQRELALSAVFEAPSLEALAARMAAVQPLAQAAPITRAERDSVLPLSFAQQRLWFLDRLQPGNPAYHVPIGARLSGQLNLDTLRATFAAIVDRHEALRTTFRLHDNLPVQCIAARLEVPFEVIGLDHVAAAERDLQIHALTQQAVLAPFDLGSGPLLRVRVVRLAADEHVVISVLHHIVSDGWSLGVLLHEIAETYTALIQRRSSTLAPLAVQYADFAAWQRRWLDADTLHTQTDYWRKQLTGAPKLLELPLDHPRPAVQRHPGATYSFSIPTSTTSALNALSQRCHATLFMTLNAAFSVLLARYSGQSDICIGTPIANRQRSELEPLIGLFINTLVMRTHVDGRLSFEALLQQVRYTALAAYAHQDVPFEQVVEALDPERDLSHTPLFQVMLVLQNTPSAELALPDLVLRAEPATVQATKFDLSLYIGETQGQLNCSFEYSTELFDAGTLERMATHLGCLLDGIVADPRQPVSRLPMLDAEARQRILHLWNQTTTAYPGNATLHALFEHQASLTPDATAVSAGVETLTYAALSARSERLARQLQARGVGRGQWVAICIERTPDMLAALLGILKAGAAYLPLDPAYPAERLGWMLEDAMPAALVTSSRLLATWPTRRVAVTLCVDDDNPASAAQDVPLPVTTADEMAYTLFTSGSTGRPKGVMVAHRNIVNLLGAINREGLVSRRDTLLSVTTLSFDIAALELFAPLLCGGHVVLASREQAADPAQLHGLIASSGATVMQATPATWRALADHGFAERGTPLSILCGGEALPADLVSRLLPHTPAICNLYGPTETTVWSTLARITAEHPRVSIGRPLANTQVYVLDELGETVPIGVPGELYIGGAGVARGYLNRPGLTAERFVPHFASAGARLYRTGDRARWLSDGSLEHLGRLDSQIKVRGLRIEPGEVEAALLAQASVSTAVVIACDQQLVAYVTRAEHATPNGLLLRGELARVLPEYMLPAHFVVLDALPLTPNGKLDRLALPAPLAARSDSIVYMAPSTPAEQHLARIWKELLKVERIGIHDNFFQLGGDSILSIQIAERARRLGLALAPPDIFRAPTLAQLARLAWEADSARAEQGSVSGEVPLTAVQQALLARYLAQPDRTHEMVLLQAYELHQPLDADVLKQVLDALVSHHDALRLTFTCVEGIWRQWHAAPGGHTLVDEQDLSGRSDPALAFLDCVDALSVEVGDLSQSRPLVRAGVYTMTDGVSRLVLAFHALVFDAASWPVLLTDLSTAYGQALRAEPLVLPMKTTSFKQWADSLPEDARVFTGTATAHRRLASHTLERPIWAQGKPADEGRAALLEAFARAYGRWAEVREVEFDVLTAGVAQAPLDLSRTLGCLSLPQPMRALLNPSGAVDVDPASSSVARVSLRTTLAWADPAAAHGEFFTQLKDVARAVWVMPATYLLAFDIVESRTQWLVQCAYDDCFLGSASVNGLLTVLAETLQTGPDGQDKPAEHRLMNVKQTFELAGLDQDELTGLLRDIGDFDAEQ